MLCHHITDIDWYLLYWLWHIEFSPVKDNTLGILRWTVWDWLEYFDHSLLFLVKALSLLIQLWPVSPLGVGLRIWYYCNAINTFNASWKPLAGKCPVYSKFIAWWRECIVPKNNWIVWHCLMRLEVLPQTQVLHFKGIHKSVKNLH